MPGVGFHLCRGSRRGACFFPGQIPARSQDWSARRPLPLCVKEGNMPTETTTPVDGKKTGKTRRQKVPLNGVDTPTLFGTLDAVKGQPELAKFQFRAKNRWKSGTLSETTIGTFSGAGGEHAHKTTFTMNGDHPTVLVGEDRAPLPIEFLLHA